MESITLDREMAHLKDELMPRYAALIYNGYWFSPERRALQALLIESQKPVNGHVRLKLYKGSVSVVARWSETDSLYDEGVVTFEDDAGAYDQALCDRVHPVERPTAQARGTQGAALLKRTRMCHTVRCASAWAAVIA